jgi:protein SCO1
MRFNLLWIIVLTGIFSTSCSNGFKDEVLPIMGRMDIQERNEGGKIMYDTLYHTIQPFAFVDQDSSWVTNETFADKIYIADFFFTSCPSICPIMKTQMLRIYDKFENSNELAFLSYSIDPKNDSVPVLKEYAERLGAKSDRWHFVTGAKEDIFEIAQNSYFSVAAEDSEAAGGLIHSGKFLLVDKKGRIRGFYDGTDPMDVDKLMNDIPVLLNEYK